MDSCSFNSLTTFLISTIVLAILLSSFAFSSIEAYDALDPNGNITIKWDLVSWTGDGYVAVVTLYNFQQYRHIAAPGWTLGWTWAKKEVIWSMQGGQTTEQGDCSWFKTAPAPHCCEKRPVVVDLLPDAPYNQQISNCCKGGVLGSWAQDPDNHVSPFQLTVGAAGTSNRTVKPPSDFTLGAPGPGYTCGLAVLVPPTKFVSSNGRRATQAIMTWNVTCTYSQFLARQTPTCCVSLSAFYNKTITPCPMCSCGCLNRATSPQNCVNPDSPNLASVVHDPSKNRSTPMVRCTNHMCPIRVHWHVKLNYRGYWRAKVTVTNFNYGKNYSQWNLVLQHPNFNNLTQIYSFNYKPLIPFSSDINDTAMLWGIKFYNDFLNEAGPAGSVQSELLIGKHESSFTFANGWAFPRRVYFNGDNCVMSSLEAYPHLPSAGSRPLISTLSLVTVFGIFIYV